MFWLLVTTQTLILLVVIAVPLFLWLTRDRFLKSLVRLTDQWSTVVTTLAEAQVPSSNYVAGLITLANANQAYNILALVRAQVDANCPGAAREINIYAAHANSALVYIGAGGVSSTNYAYVLNADDMRGYSSTYQNVILGSLFAVSTSAQMKLGIEVMSM